MLARVETCTVRGVEAFPIRVEVDLSTGLPAFTIVGLAQGAVREGRERVGAALANSGYALPHRRITVNLAPADLRKEGTGFDLPIAVGILVASGELHAVALQGTMLIGELGLDGSVRPVPGVLPAAILARERALARLVVPADNADEAALVSGVDVMAVESLTEVVDVLAGRCSAGGRPSSVRRLTHRAPAPQTSVPDLCDVRGQAVARRALEIVAAGGHHLVMVGGPGVGKTMLARRLPGIMPPLEPQEALEVARVHSVAGLLLRGGALPGRPFRAPHHSVSYAGLAGGGTPIRPGEISLSHHGVLFLDELPEYQRNVVEVLRQPMEEGWVTLSRARGTVRFPSRFLLVAAMNPCPCGFLGDGTDRCLCDDAAVSRYMGRVSGPLLDRVDLRVETPAPPMDPFGAVASPESTSVVARRVLEARKIQVDRLRDIPGIFTNAHLGSREIRTWCRPTHAARRSLRVWAERGRLSARGYDRVLRVARTIADLDGADALADVHVGEALQYRVGFDRG